jgi:hypothetical protein
MGGKSNARPPLVANGMHNGVLMKTLSGQAELHTQDL